MIVWLNGAFGAGKTSVAMELTRLMPDLVLYDPEHVGEMLVRMVAPPSGDFQDLPAWRELVVATGKALHAHTAATLIAPMTLLRRSYADEIFTGLRRHAIAIHHVLLDAAPAELRRRIDAADPDVDPAVRHPRRRWRTARIADYLDALPWLRAEADLVIDTTGRAPTDVAHLVVAGTVALSPPAR